MNGTSMHTNTPSNEDLHAFLQRVENRQLEHHEETRRTLAEQGATLADLKRTLQTLVRTGTAHETPAALDIPEGPAAMPAPRPQTWSARVAVLAARSPRLAMALTVGAAIGSAVAAFLAQYHPR